MTEQATISVDDAEEAVYGAVAIQDVSQHRWYTRQLVVFVHDGSLMGLHYLRPASELQEDQDRFDADPVPIFPVVAKEVVTTVYEKA